MPHPLTHLLRVASATLGIALALAPSFGAEGSSLQLEELADQNRRLHEQVRDQQKTIEAIAARLMHVLRVSERHERELLALHQRLDAAPATVSRPRSVSEGTRRETPTRATHMTLLPPSTGWGGQFPECEFRIDQNVLPPAAVEWTNASFGPELKLRMQRLTWNPARDRTAGFRLVAKSID